MIKNSDKEKYVYSGYRITFDSAGSWSFDNDLARDVIVFGTDNSSTSHSDNFKNNFLILVEVPTYGINGRFESPEKNININFAKANSKFYLRLHYVAGLLMERKSLILTLLHPHLEISFCMERRRHHLTLRQLSII